MSNADFEKMGVFYLGKDFAPATRTVTPALTLYESKDLATHGVCIGMTGSGKTGLCITLLEEAAIDGIPVIAIDPKGDIANILLQFPELRASDFEPWIDPDQARRSGRSLDQYSQEQADAWRDGLAEWQQDGQRIRVLNQSADFSIYTPGSTAGIPVSLIRSFAAPPAETMNDADAFRESIGAAASSLSALLGIEADPLRSREHILFANIFKHFWQSGLALSLPQIIQAVQKPPINQVGAIDIDVFYPPKERFELAMGLNNLLASPGFETWMEGVPLDIDSMLYTAEGKPRVSVFSISHLSDAERMFFVSLLLNQMVSWMRRQSGTSSLRALIYMDEIYGYFPPTANPPTKTPLLTLMKQGRAFGLGVLLASQNPADLDYKGLANAGTWFIGRLQTERDKLRVLDGLEGLASGTGNFNRQEMDKLISSLGNRVFLLNNVHNDGPLLFKTRWTLSYLRGPLTREQIKQLNFFRKASLVAAPTHSHDGETLSTKQTGVDSGISSATPQPSSFSSRPLVAPGVAERFLPIRVAQPTGSKLIYKPMLLGFGNIRFVDAKSAVDTTLQYPALLKIESESAITVDWSKAKPAKVWIEDLEPTPHDSASFAPLVAGLGDAKSYSNWTKQFIAWLYNAKRVKLLADVETGLFSKPRESERDFRIRLSIGAREARDRAAENLKAKYAVKFASLQERLRKAQQVLEREESQVREAQLQSAVSIGSTVLEALMGRKTFSRTSMSRAGRAARNAGKTMQQQQDAQHAAETVEALSEQLEDLNLKFGGEMNELDGKFDSLQVQLKEVVIAPKRTNISVPFIGLAWAPFFKSPDGQETAGWTII